MTKSKSSSSSFSSSLSLDSGSSGIPLLRDRWSRRISRSPIVPSSADLATQQQFKDECDMNLIVANAKRGIPPRFLNPSVPQFGDFSDVPDLATAFNLIQEAYEAFLNLPAALRAELGNDPARINELTHDQAVRYNLLRTPAATPSSQPADSASAAGQAASNSGSPEVPPVKKPAKTE